MQNKKDRILGENHAQQLSVWDFVSLVSHQLRNPLASTKLSLEMLLEGQLGPLTDEQKEYLKMMAEDNQRMIRLVKEFLTISAIERGEITLSPEPVDLRMLTLEIIQELRSFAAAHNVRIHFTPPEEFPKLNVDKLKIRQVINNIIDNAIKYTRGGGEVEITLEHTKNLAQFSCKDNGIGIPQEAKEHIFSKFFRSENAGKVDSEGTGIGLYIAKAIVEKSRGEIGFESEENKGTTFWFRLPTK